MFSINTSICGGWHWWMLRRSAENIDLALWNYTEIWIVWITYLFSPSSLVGGSLPMAIMTFEKLMGWTSTCLLRLGMYCLCKVQMACLFHADHSLLLSSHFHSRHYVRWKIALIDCMAECWIIDLYASASIRLQQHFYFGHCFFY